MCEVSLYSEAKGHIKPHNYKCTLEMWIIEQAPNLAFKIDTKATRAQRC